MTAMKIDDSYNYYTNNMNRLVSETSHHHHIQQQQQQSCSSSSSSSSSSASPESLPNPCDNSQSSFYSQTHLQTAVVSATAVVNQQQQQQAGFQYMPKCPLCDKTFANSSNLKHHMNTIHFNEAKWICNECGKVCTSKSNLKVHLRVHLRVKPYYCRWCDYNCMHHSSIRDHLSKCHPEKAHNSSEPGYIFNSAAVPEPEITSNFDHLSAKQFEAAAAAMSASASYETDGAGLMTTSCKKSSSSSTSIVGGDEDNGNEEESPNDDKHPLVRKKKPHVAMFGMNAAKRHRFEADPLPPPPHDDHNDEELVAGDEGDNDSAMKSGETNSTPNDIIANLFFNNTVGQNGQPNGQINSLASSLIQRLSASALMHQINAAFVAATGAQQHQQLNIHQHLQQSHTDVGNTSPNVLDLSIRNNENIKKRLKRHGASEPTDDSSPISPASSLSSSSSSSTSMTTTSSAHSQSALSTTSTLKSQNVPPPPPPTTSKPGTNPKKAISDVINRLSSSLPRTTSTTPTNSSSAATATASASDSTTDLSQENLQNNYKCKFCNIIFDDYSLYSIHAGMHANENPWQCNVCGHTCANKVEFAVHILHLPKI